MADCHLHNISKSICGDQVDSQPFEQPVRNQAEELETAVAPLLFKASQSSCTEFRPLSRIFECTNPFSLQQEWPEASHLCRGPRR